MVFKWVLLFIQQELTILFFDFFFSLKIDSFAIWENMNYYQFSYLLSGVKWKSLSRVQLCDPMDCVHGILQARILEWVTFPFSRGSSQPRDWTWVSTLLADSLPSEYQGCKEADTTGHWEAIKNAFLYFNLPGAGFANSSPQFSPDMSSPGENGNWEELLRAIGCPSWVLPLRMVSLQMVWLLKRGSGR